MSFGPRLCSTTSAVTVAFLTSGAPTETFPSPLTSNTRSSVVSLPASALRRSTTRVSPALTRYFLLPDSTTAYINYSQKKGPNQTTRYPRCQRVFWQNATAIISTSDLLCKFYCTASGLG